VSGGDCGRGPGNIVLIGMPAVGKSTLGVLLAKATSRDFLDTDVHLQARAGRALREIVERDGPAVFRALEERVVLTLACVNSVIATGGSVVYSEAAMRHLRRGAVVVHLDLALSELAARLPDLGKRGVVRAPGQSLEDVFAERAPLYRRHADLRIDCRGKTHEALVDEIAAAAAGWHVRDPNL